jgi:hypothetical protein
MMDQSTRNKVMVLLIVRKRRLDHAYLRLYSVESVFLFLLYKAVSVGACRLKRREEQGCNRGSRRCTGIVKSTGSVKCSHARWTVARSRGCWLHRLFSRILSLVAKLNWIRSLWLKCFSRLWLAGMVFEIVVVCRDYLVLTFTRTGQFMDRRRANSVAWNCYQCFVRDTIWTLMLSGHLFNEKVHGCRFPQIERAGSGLSFWVSTGLGKSYGSSWSVMSFPESLLVKRAYRHAH